MSDVFDAAGVEAVDVVLGIDGGGTRTRAAFVAADGRVVGYAVNGPSNIDDVGVEVAQANIDAAVSAAALAAGIDRSRCQAVFLGMAGIVSDEDRARIRGIAERLTLAPVDRIGVHHDCRIALAGGLSGRPGIVLIAGTGSSCYGRNGAGADWMVGGRGHLISDEGSSYWLGVQAMRLAVKAYDGRLAPSPVVNAVLQYLGIGHMDEVLHRVYVTGLNRVEIAAMAPIVVELAQQGEPNCAALVALAGEELAECVLAAVRHLGFEDGCEVCTVGGLVEQSGMVADALTRTLQQHLPNARLYKPELPPVLGASLLAFELSGTALNETLLRTLAAAKERI